MFAKLSSQQKAIKISIDNVFVTDYMPYAPENFVKVYLLGLSYAFAPSEDSTLSALCQKLDMSESEVKNAFQYWAGQGIVNVTEINEYAVEYLPVTAYSHANQKFSKTKYSDFSNQLNAMLAGRQILPAEFNEYYSVMEEYHLEPNAMLAIVSYCIRLKGENVSYKYIIAVARNMASNNLISFERVNEELSKFDAFTPETDKIMKALSSKAMPDHNDKNLYLKWTKDYGFDLETIVTVAKNQVKKGDFARLDKFLTRYYENHLYSISEIENYIKNRDHLYEIAKQINKIIGVYYEQLDYIIESYISKWLNLGFDEDTLFSIAEYCFKHFVKTLDGMDEIVLKFYQQGIVSKDSINEFVTRSVTTDKEIKEILTECGLSRNVTSRDRDCYRTWTHSWKMSKDVIMYVASLSKNSAYPMSVMNNILSSYTAKGIDTVEKAKNSQPVYSTNKTENEVKKTYTSEQLNAMFDNLSYEDI